MAYQYRILTWMGQRYTMLLRKRESPIMGNFFHLHWFVAPLIFSCFARDSRVRLLSRHAT